MEKEDTSAPRCAVCGCPIDVARVQAGTVKVFRTSEGRIECEACHDGRSAASTVRRSKSVARTRTFFFGAVGTALLVFLGFRVWPTHRELQASQVSSIGEIPTGARVICAEVARNGNAVALLARLQNRVELYISGQPPVSFERYTFHSRKPSDDYEWPRIEPTESFAVVRPDDTDDVFELGDDPSDCLLWGPGAWPSRYLAFDPSGEHFAYAFRSKGRSRMVVDGRAEAAYDEVRPLTFSETGGRYAYVARDHGKDTMVVDGEAGPKADEISGGPVFSADGTTVGYIARTPNQKCVAVVNGVAGPEYDEIEASALWISANGEHVFYPAKKSGALFGVWDGKEGPKDAVMVDRPIFSPDGGRCAYLAVRENDSGEMKWRVVVDGQSGAEYDDIGSGAKSVSFSPDGSRVAYQARSKDRFCFVIDGKEGPWFDGLATGAATFSPRGDRVAYAATRGDKWMVVVDGKQGEECDGLFGFVFSADGQKFFHGEVCGEELVVLVNGEARWTLRGKPATDPILSPALDRHAFVVRRAGKAHVVVDGKEDEACDAVSPPRFSADGRHVAYVAHRNGSSCLVVDSVTVGAAYDAIVSHPSFSSDDHVVFCAARGEKTYVVVDGKESDGFDHVYGHELLQFRTDGSLGYIAQQGQRVVRVEHGR